MKCSIQGCPGAYERRQITHVVKRGGDVLVFEDVPADVCTVCSDVLLDAATVRRLDEMIHHPAHATRMVPAYEFA